jgi:hypothetical protein
LEGPLRQQPARDAARNRAAVLAACRELLFRDGYDRMTVRSVAEKLRLWAGCVAGATSGWRRCTACPPITRRG